GRWLLDISDQLQKLQQLHASGALTDAEFSRAKQAVLGGTPREAAREADGASLRARFLQKAPTGPPPGAPEKPPAPSASASAAPGQPCPYGPVAPKFATLESGEQHRFTFGIQPFVYKKGKFFPPVVAGWYLDLTRFLWHLTDRRILIEPYEVS